MKTTVEQEDMSRTERFVIYDGIEVVSRAYLTIPYGFNDKSIWIYDVKTNKSHLRQGLCRKVIEQVIELYGRYDIELIPHKFESWGMSKKQLEKFYKSFGFRRKKRSFWLYNSMIRKGVQS